MNITTNSITLEDPYSKLMKSSPLVTIVREDDEQMVTTLPYIARKTENLTKEVSPLQNGRESVNVLHECIDLQLRKSMDYQNPKSNVTQAMHYRRGIDTIHDTLQGKILRAQSLIESGNENVNFESLEDTYKDIINYASFAVAWLRKKIPGQSIDRDIFNCRYE